MAAASADDPANALDDHMAGLDLEADDGKTVPVAELWKRKQDLKGTAFGMPGMGVASGGGAKCIDASQLSEQKTVVTHLIKSMGSNLMEGKSIINISLPVSIFEPRSFLHRMTDVWQFAPLYLSRAAAVEGDPIERMKQVVTFYIAGMHRGMKQQKPFNPILGETYQGRFPDGTEVYCEQVSHHPPVSAFQLFGSCGRWKFYGHHEYVATFRPNGLIGGQHGPNTVEFDDGTKITFDMAHLKLSGVLFGERVITYTDKIVFRDAKSDIRCEIELNPDAVSGLRSWVYSAKTPADTFRGALYMGDREVCSAEGSWLRELRFGDKVYWKLGEVAPVVPHLPPSSEVLPSDARFRSDLKALLAGQAAEAEAEKKRLEEEQRRDRRLRKDCERERGTPSTDSSVSSASTRSY